MPEYPEFPEREFKDRIARTQQAMKENDLDALFLTSWENVYHLSGFQSASFAGTKDWPYGLIIKADGDAQFIVRATTGEVAARETSWIEKISSYNLVSDSEDAFRRVFRESGLTGARVGAELGDTQSVKFSTGLFLKLVQSSGVKFVDGASAIWAVRMIKSEMELERIRNAALIASKAGERAFGKLREGMTEWEFARLVAQYMIEEGAEKPSWTVIVVSGKRFDTLMGGAFPTERKFRRGDFVQIDWGATYRYYTSDLNRIAKIGEQPSESDKELWNLYVDASEAAMHAIRPGVLACEVYEATAKVFEEAGIPVTTPRVGHGLGLEAHEPPHLGAYDRTKLRAGMALSIEPYGIPNKEGRKMNCEDNGACTENGFERYSTIDREIFVV